jgi:K+-transporting ATPase ATPase C chain
MKAWITEIKTSLLATLTLAILLCGVYPLAVHLIGRGFFPGRADGSLIRSDGAVMGSSLIGRSFEGPRYFHPRPSAAGTGYDGTASGGTNLGPLSKALNEAVASRAAAYRQENGLPVGTLVPADAVTSSASGLDPHISPANAALQVARVARARELSEDQVQKLVAENTAGRQLGFLGEPAVNVLKLNLALDKAAPGKSGATPSK